MADINEFMGRVMARGFQRTNQYRCKLDLTQFGTDFAGVPKAHRLLREGLLCRTTMTPSREIETTSVDLAIGYEEKYAIGTTYNDIDCTFLCPLIDGTNQVLTLFHAWQNRIQNRGKAGWGDENADMVLSFPNTYRLMQGMKLELLSGAHVSQPFVGPTEPFVGPPEPAMFRTERTERGPGPSDITSAFEYFEVYPTSVNGTTVDWLSMDEMMEVAVTFSYTHWQQVKDESL